MFLMELKTLLVKAFQSTFDEANPAADWLKYGHGDNTGKLNVSIEFPVAEQDYPCVWVDFEPTQQLRTAGINHVEYVDGEGEETSIPVRRWRFAGMATYTGVAFTSAVRDRLFDELIAMIASSQDDPIRARFRSGIEENDLIGITIDWDEVALSGFTATPGTPWGTDEMMYEFTVRLEMIGEFLTDPNGSELVHLSRVDLHPYNDQEADPLPAGTWQ